MNTFQPELDKETIESAFTQIHYYRNLPKHIKEGSNVSRYGCPGEEPSFSLPAHVVEGTTTVIGGRLNIPALTQVPQFMNVNFQSY